MTVAAWGAVTGISIFIDSRMTSSSPSATTAPTSVRTCHTLAVISARTSLMHAPSDGDAGHYRGPAILEEGEPGPDALDRARVDVGEQHRLALGLVGGTGARSGHVVPHGSMMRLSPA